MDELLRQVLPVFLVEVREQAQRIAAALLLMEREPSSIPSEIEELFRQAHSLKGSSASLGILELEALAHELETALTGVRRHQQPLTRELVDLGLRAVDAAQERAQGLGDESEAGLAKVVAITAELRALVERSPLPEQSQRSTEPARASRQSLPASELSGPLGESVAPPPDAEAPKPDPALLVDNPDIIRVPTARLLDFERRTDDLRTLHGRMERHAAELHHAGQALERLGRELRRLWPKAAVAAGALSAPDELRQVQRTLRALRHDVIVDLDLLLSTSTELSESLRAMRLVPAALLTQPLLRAVREACKQAEHEADLELVGDQVRVDRVLLEELRGPLLHLVRNAVDHGIEPSAVREAVGKPARGRIEVRLQQSGGRVVITVRDDGRGIDVAAVRRQAVARGLITEAAAETLEPREVHRLLLLPGFSTAAEVTTLSGRGVGLDVVHSVVQRLQGELQIESQLGQGAAFTLSVPMTIVAARVMLIEEQGGVYGVPQTAVERIVLASPKELTTVGKGLVYVADGEALPVARLSHVLGGRIVEWPRQLPLLILRHGETRVALGCERLEGESELVLQPLPAELLKNRLLSAVAMLPSGAALFVLSPAALAAATVEKSTVETRLAQRTVLVADDSITTRSLLRSVLEGGGYRVRTAADGEEALRLLRSESVDLVVSDVRMPRLDGYSLVSKLREDPRTARLPVVLFSGADSDDDRRRGVAAGADAYLTKGAFERGQLIDVVTGLLQGAA